MIGDTATHTPTVIGVAGTTYAYYGLPLSAWVSIATLVYLVIQIITAAPKAVAVIQRIINKEALNVQSNDDPS